MHWLDMAIDNLALKAFDIMGYCVLSHSDKRWQHTIYKPIPAIFVIQFQLLMFEMKIESIRMIQRYVYFVCVCVCPR